MSSIFLFINWQPTGGLMFSLWCSARTPVPKSHRYCLICSMRWILQKRKMIKNRCSRPYKYANRHLLFLSIASLWTSTYGSCVAVSSSRNCSLYTHFVGRLSILRVHHILQRLGKLYKNQTQASTTPRCPKTWYFSQHIPNPNLLEEVNARYLTTQTL